jgi:HPt (histidine-containing phosphotransfer) domain-containing protein
LLDAASLLIQVGNDDQLLIELIQIFLADLPPLLQGLREAAETNNLPNLERCAHTLKGAISIFGAKSPIQTAIILEQIGRTKGSEDPVPLYLRLESELNDLRKELTDLERTVCAQHS